MRELAVEMAPLVRSMRCAGDGGQGEHDVPQDTRRGVAREVRDCDAEDEANEDLRSRLAAFYATGRSGFADRAGG